MRRRLVVVSHPNVVPHNQLVYVRLAELGWDLRLVTPARWKDDYSPHGFVTEPLEGLVGTFHRMPLALPGAYQRHFYVTRPARRLRRWRPDAVFLEQEPYAVPTLQWGQACVRLGLPWAIQGDDNIDRPLPAPARAIRAWAMPRVGGIAARSPSAAAIMLRWGARCPVEVVPHTIPEWPGAYEGRERAPETPFTIGFAGRLVALKGIDDLLAAVRSLAFPFRLLVVGDGPLRERVADADLGRGTLDLRTGVRSAEMAGHYREMDVLVLPSRATPTWAEQFGKVLCEALLCGTPVVGARSGEIPWVVETSGGGVLFPEGDVAALARELARLRDAPEERARLASVGRAGVERHFAPRVAARALDGLLNRALEGNSR
jgi:glycosyltransferase involved in cell wall biosynthesis